MQRHLNNSPVFQGFDYDRWKYFHFKVTIHLKQNKKTTSIYTNGFIITEKGSALAGVSSIPVIAFFPL